jgi:hypothetical protein
VSIKPAYFQKNMGFFRKNGGKICSYMEKSHNIQRGADY